jgi:zinc protease
LNAYLAHPGWRAPTFERWRVDALAGMEDLRADPYFAARMDFLPRVFEADRTRVMPDAGRVAELELEELRAWLEPEFERAPMTVVVWGGALDPVRGAVARSFGLLSERAEPRGFLSSLRTNPLVPGLRQEFPLEGAQQGLVYIAVPTADGRIPSRRWGLELLARVLDARLQQRVREQLGFTYGPATTSYASRVFKGYGFLRVTVPAAPEHLDGVLSACLEVLAELGRQGIGREELERARAPARVAHAERYWTDVLTGYRAGKDGLHSWNAEGEFLATVGVARLNRYARRFVSPERASVGVFRPR